MKKLLSVFAVMLSVMLLVSSCSRSLSPYEAANGKAKCKKTVR